VRPHGHAAARQQAHEVAVAAERDVEVGEGVEVVEVGDDVVQPPAERAWGTGKRGEKRGGARRA
jgi:hypothetical protein